MHILTRPGRPAAKRLRAFGDFSYVTGAYSDDDNENIELDVPTAANWYFVRVYGYMGAANDYSFWWDAS